MLPVPPAATRKTYTTWASEAPRSWNFAPSTFRYTKPYADGSKPVQYGLIAEEVAETFPDLVARSVDGQIETVKYQLLDPLLLNEVQRQQKEIVAQKDRINDLQQQINELKAAMASLARQ